jgi:hypothetical protein
MPVSLIKLWANLNISFSCSARLAVSITTVLLKLNSCIALRRIWEFICLLKRMQENQRKHRQMGRSYKSVSHFTVVWSRIYNSIASLHLTRIFVKICLFRPIIIELLWDCQGSTYPVAFVSHQIDKCCIPLANILGDAKRSRKQHPA